MRARVPMSDSINTPGVSLDREVRVEARRGRDDQDLTDLIRIAWSPEGRTIFPSFEGTPIVCGEADEKSSHIELDGSYTPPLGAAGQVFDDVIGHRIAESTAREFLNDLKRAIERS